MATVAGSLTAWSEGGYAHTIIGRLDARSGKVVQSTHRKRTANARAKAFTNCIRLLAKEDWPTVAPGAKTSWKNPFGPAAYTRQDAVLGLGNGWTCFVMAHFEEQYFRKQYFASSPDDMPNAFLTLAVTNIDWTAQTATADAVLHFYTEPGQETSIIIYQISPKRYTHAFPHRWTRRLATIPVTSSEMTDYSIPFPFAFRVTPGQHLAVYGRVRSTGGHSIGGTVAELRP